MNCEEIRENLEAYALGTLDASERKAIEAHLSECDDCPTFAREYAAIADTMHEALAAASPRRVPTGLKRRVLDSLDAPKPAPEPRPRLGWLRWRTVGFALLVLIAAIGIAQTAQLSVALAQERALRAEYANLVDQQELVLDVIDSPRTVRVVLRSTNGSPAYGKLYSRPDMPYVVAMIARLPMPPEGQSYHLWLTRSGQTKLAGVLKVNAQGFGLLVYQAAQNGPTFDSAQVMLQADGSTQPLGPAMLNWEVGK